MNYNINVLDAALIQQFVWELEEILYKCLIRQLDDFGRAEFNFGDRLF